MAQSSDIVDGLRLRLEAVLLPRLPTAGRFALLDYPNHENVGDAAIWTGERAFLAAHCREVVYVSDLQNFSAVRLRRNLGAEGVILLHGGGNFGDLYPHHQRHREEVIDSFPDHPIIQLPQTATFTSDSAAQAARAAYARHENLTLLLRDAVSLGFTRQTFGNPSLLAPDSAVALTPAPAEPRSDRIVWLARTDAESSESREASRAAQDAAGDVSVVDWVGKRHASPRLVVWRGCVLLAGSLSAHLPSAISTVDRWIGRSFDTLAESRVNVGYEMLSAGRVVVTDRLHGHILASLLEVPHVLLNDRYDKVGRFYRSWSTDQPNVRFATDPHEALRSARELLELSLSKR